MKNFVIAAAIIIGSSAAFSSCSKKDAVKSTVTISDETCGEKADVTTADIAA